MQGNRRCWQQAMSEGGMQVPPTNKLGRIAFITTPNVRSTSSDRIEKFVCRHLRWMCDNFEVVTTGRTYELVKNLTGKSLESLRQGHRDLLRHEAGVTNSVEFANWRDAIWGGLISKHASYPGMIEVTCDLVEQRLDAVIHFTDWADKVGKPDSAVLAGQANVHDVPIATDFNTAESFIATWRSSLAGRSRVRPLFRERRPPSAPPAEKLTDGMRVLGMIAHDNMKLEMCRLAVERAAAIYANFDHIIATGKTGAWLKAFMLALGRSGADIDRIVCCNSGLTGGGVQIAHAVVKGLCRKVIFLQDALVSHPHVSDISLFEQAVLIPDLSVELATNAESAKLLIEA
jgi:methylglyoxal synthase